MNSRPATSSLSRLSAAILLLFQLGLLLNWHHQAAFQHVVCAEDGELTHFAQAHEHGDDHCVDPEQQGEESSEEEDHEHCGLPSLGQASDVPGATYSLSFNHLTLAVRLVEPSSAELEQVALFLLAPKNSPPVGA